MQTMANFYRKIKIVFFIHIIFFITNSCTRGNDPELAKHYNEAVFGRALEAATGGNKKMALKITDSAYSTFPYISVADKYRYYSFMFDLFNAYYSSLNNNDSALAYCDSMLTTIESHKKTQQMSSEYARAYGNKASIFMNRRNYEEAIREAAISRLIAENNGDSCSLAGYNSTIAFAMFRQARFVEAASYYKLSAGELAGCPETALKFHDMQGSLDNVGLAYTRAAMPDSALVYYDKAEYYIDKNKALCKFDSTFPKIAKAVLYGQKAQALQEKGDYKTAEELFNKSIAVNLQKGYDNQFAAQMRLRLADLYMQTGNNTAVLNLLNGAKAGFNEFKTAYEEDRKLYWLKLMYKYYARTGDDINTNTYLQLYLRLDDSLKLKDKNLAETNGNDMFTHLQYEKEATLLEKDNTLQKTYIAGLGSIILLVAAVAFAVRRNWLKARERSLALVNLNNQLKQNGIKLEKLLEQLEIQSKEKERIMRVVAHDLKNPLSGINILIDNYEGKSPEEKARFLEMIELACSDSLELVNEILAAPAGTESIALNKTKVDINHLLTDSINLMQLNAAKKGSIYIFRR